MLLSTLLYCKVAEVGAAEPARLSSARNLQPSPCKLSALQIFQFFVLLWAHLSHRSNGWSCSQHKEGGKMGW